MNGSAAAPGPLLTELACCLRALLQMVGPSGAFGNGVWPPDIDNLVPIMRTYGLYRFKERWIACFSP